MAVMAAFGRSGRMSGAQAAEMNIGLRVVLSTLERDFDALELPSELRGWNWQALRLNGGILPGHAEHGPSDCGAQPNVALYRTVRANHTQILSRCPEVVADAIEDVASRTGRSLLERRSVLEAGKLLFIAGIAAPNCLPGHLPRSTRAEADGRGVKDHPKLRKGSLGTISSGINRNHHGLSVGLWSFG